MAPVAGSRGRWLLAIGLIAVASGTAVGAGVLLKRSAHETTVDESAVAAPSFTPGDDAGELRACKKAITKVRGSWSSGAPCRSLLHLHDSLALDPNVRGQIAQWARAEDNLAGLITRIQEGTGTPQLWRAYDNAISVRDAVLVDIAL